MKAGPAHACCLAIALTAAAAAAQQNEADPAADAPASETPASTPEPQPEERRTATVVLLDGQVMTGELVSENDEQIVLLISGIRTSIDTDRIRESYIQPPVEQRYRQIRATIADDDAEQLVQIAEWLLARSRPDLAIPDLETALRADPFHQRARELLLVAREAQKLLESKQDPVEPQDEGAHARPRPPAAHEEADAFPLITDEDVNIIRVYEVDLEDPPRMTISRDTMESVFQTFAGQPGIPATQAGRETILQSQPVEQLELLFSLRAREFYDQVTVLNDPDALERFRDDVYGTWLARGCSSFRCHGGSEAGRLQLPRSRKTDPKVYLTAMLILEAYRTNEGTALLNFDDPAQSVLLHAGLPRHLSRHPHPDTAGWRPVFRSTSDSRFRQGARWIEAMYTPRPAYPIDYDPPTAMEPGQAEPRSPR